MLLNGGRVRPQDATSSQSSLLRWGIRHHEYEFRLLPIWLGPFD